MVRQKIWARLYMLPALVVCVDAVGDALPRRPVVGLLQRSQRKSLKKRKASLFVGLKQTCMPSQSFHIVTHMEPNNQAHW